jgi:hypothetical protein
MAARVHHAHDDEQRHQRPAAAKAPGPVVGAGAHVPQPTAIGPVVQQQRQRRTAMLQAAGLQRGELVYPAAGEHDHRDRGRPGWVIVHQSGHERGEDKGHAGAGVRLT